MTRLLFLSPIFKKTIWGGSQLETKYGFSCDSGTGECWSVSAHDHGMCTVENGEYKGMTLKEIWTQYPQLFGNESGKYGKQYPLLVKIIDAKENLSIQVHPDDNYAREHEKGSLGKMECWYILDCKKDASIIIGHSFPWLTARMLGAELHDIAQGGIALMDGQGWFHRPVQTGMESAWDKVHYNTVFGEMTKWDFSKFVPQVVIVALGQNDNYPDDYMKEVDEKKAQGVCVHELEWDSVTQVERDYSWTAEAAKENR